MALCLTTGCLFRTHMPWNPKVLRKKKNHLPLFTVQTELFDQHLQRNQKLHNAQNFFCVLTVRKCQYADDKEEGDDQDEPHPEITVRIPIISVMRGDRQRLMPAAVMIFTQHTVHFMSTPLL